MKLDLRSLDDMEVFKYLIQSALDGRIRLCVHVESHQRRVKHPRASESKKMQRRVIRTTK